MPGGNASFDEDLIPLFKPESRPPLPVELSTLKRKKMVGAGASDRHRIYSGYGDEDLIVDDELLEEEDRLFAELEDEYEEEEEIIKRQKIQESTTREMIAEEKLRAKRRSGHKLTRDEKRLAIVLRRNSTTNTDLQARYANDQDSLISLPVIPPFQSFVNETLGPEEPRTRCFACVKGVGLARIAPRAIASLERVIKESISTQDVWTACLTISQHYEVEIRIPSNAGRNPNTEAELLPWSQRMVFDHLTKHILEPSFVMFTEIMEVRAHLRVISSAGFYRVSKEVFASDREIQESDLIIDDKRHKQFIETKKLLMQMLNQKPERMMFSNDQFNVHAVPQHIVVPKSSAKEVVRQKSIFTVTDLTQKSTYKQL